jgi:glycosyltransferase involved in cell wall biosynthesis|tara:strand:+ start:8412 stop:9146 length:735 start_codon:yes stop_codon:yes gene_type:complete
MQPLISIITVTKDCNSTIDRTLKSIQSIKDTDIQFIVIDGKSVDGTLLNIERYENLVDILVSEDDTGIYNAMNKGTMLAKAKYILFVNGDDYILADGFNKAKTVLSTHKPDILSCQSEVFENDGDKGVLLSPCPWKLLFFNSIPHLSTFVSSKLQKKYRFREKFKIAADYDFFLRLFVKRYLFMTSKLITAVHYRGGFSNNTLMSNAEIKQIRKDNLSFILYFITKCISILNRLRKKIISQNGV